jgi:hypothetical protein
MLIVLKMQTKVHFKIGHVNDTLLEQNMFVRYHAKVMCNVFAAVRLFQPNLIL